MPGFFVGLLRMGLGMVDVGAMLCAMHANRPSRQTGTRLEEIQSRRIMWPR